MHFETIFGSPTNASSIKINNQMTLKITAIEEAVTLINTLKDVGGIKVHSHADGQIWDSIGMEHAEKALLTM